MILHRKKPLMTPLKKLLEMPRDIVKFQGTKLSHTKKPVFFLYVNNKLPEKKLRKSHL